MVTAGTYLKLPRFRGADRLRYLCETLLDLAEQYAMRLQAWAVFPNHYHFVALACDASTLSRAGASSCTPKGTLTEFTRHLHSITAIQANQWDQTTGRQTWFQYRDTQLTFQKSYLARLGYVHKNAVHHGLVSEPSLYPWCSAGWFQRRAPTSLYRTIMCMKIDRIQVVDDYTVIPSDI